jgi:hypothetical protein
MQSQTRETMCGENKLSWAVVHVVYRCIYNDYYVAYYSVPMIDSACWIFLYWACPAALKIVQISFSDTICKLCQTYIYLFRKVWAFSQATLNPELVLMI